MRTKVAIIGGGPSGLLLSRLLNLAGISTVVLERKTRDYVVSRIRAGVLEWTTVEMLRMAGLGDRMDREGIIHDGCHISAYQRMFRVDFEALCGRRVMVYGQTELTRDLYDAHQSLDGSIIHEAEDVALHDLDGQAPFVSYSKDGLSKRIDCDFVAGCDGFHGVSRNAIPVDRRQVYEKIYPFGWLGVLSRTPPVCSELIYAAHDRGFALASMRNAMLSRYYIQVPLSDQVKDWSDDAFWEELKRRLPAEVATQLVSGPSIEKSIAALRSFVTEPMQWGRLFLCGDAAHIVPPTGAKGLNLAASDVFYLSEAFKAYYTTGGGDKLEGYSQKALARVWKATRFSWSMTMMLHRFADDGPYDQRMQETELGLLETSVSARRFLAENYTGLPF